MDENLEFRIFQKPKILKLAKVLNSGIWKVKILKIGKNVEFKIYES